MIIITIIIENLENQHYDIRDDMKRLSTTAFKLSCLSGKTHVGKRMHQDM